VSGPNRGLATADDSPEPDGFPDETAVAVVNVLAERAVIQAAAQVVASGLPAEQACFQDASVPGSVAAAVVVVCLPVEQVWFLVAPAAAADESPVELHYYSAAGFLRLEPGEL
jgi:hypothetical protein